MEGSNLNKCQADQSKSSSATGTQQHEQHVLEVAAQLLQVSLKMNRQFCPLPVFLTFFTWSNMQTVHCLHAVAPQGATPVYASPEVLRSLQLQHEGAAFEDVGVTVNGPAADFCGSSAL